MARLRSLSSGERTFAGIKNLRRREEIKMHGRVDAIRIQIAKLEKEAQQARRAQNVQALMDIKRQQINLIGELRMQTLGKQQDLELTALEANLKHEMSLDQIRLKAILEADLGLTGGGSQGERAIIKIEELEEQIAQTTNPTEKRRLQEQRDLWISILKGRGSDEAIIKDIMANADDPESGLDAALSMYALPEIVKYIPAYQGTRTVAIPNQVPGTVNASFQELHSSLSRRKKKDKKGEETTPYTTEEIIGIWRQGTEV